MYYYPRPPTSGNNLFSRLHNLLFCSHNLIRHGGFLFMRIDCNITCADEIISCPNKIQSCAEKNINLCGQDNILSAQD